MKRARDLDADGEDIEVVPTATTDADSPVGLVTEAGTLDLWIDGRFNWFESKHKLTKSRGLTFETGVERDLWVWLRMRASSVPLFIRALCLNGRRVRRAHNYDRCPPGLSVSSPIMMTKTATSR